LTKSFSTKWFNPIFAVVSFDKAIPSCHTLSNDFGLGLIQFYNHIPGKNNTIKIVSVNQTKKINLFLNEMIVRLLHVARVSFL